MSKPNDYLVDGHLPTIGIECHVQLKTKSKLFGTASNESIGAEPNTLVDQLCFGYPGALPVLNKQAVLLASKAAFALKTKPQRFSKFDRKHYFYPDLPKGYQISQFDQPIILDGRVTIQLESGDLKEIQVERAHLEEDAGKSTHPTMTEYSLVDLNRAGTPLLEIVSAPDMHNSYEAKAYAEELWLLMKYAGVSDVDLYHGNMRFDVNVSVSKDVDKLGIRTETKNLNSFRSIERAVNYEIKRQISLLEKGEQIVQETRGWLDDAQKTVSQRSKEDAHDYRYFPDPDIPPVILDDQYIQTVEKEVPKMPDQLRSELNAVGIDVQTIETLLISRATYETDFLSCIVDSKENVTARTYANWIVNIEVPLHRSASEKENRLAIDPAIRNQVFAQTAQLISENKLSSNNAKAIIEELLPLDKLESDVETYANGKGYIQVSNGAELEAIVDQILSDNPQAAEDIKNGEMKAIGFLVGQVMKQSKGKANPSVAKDLITKKLVL